MHLAEPNDGRLAHRSSATAAAAGLVKCGAVSSSGATDGASAASARRAGASCARLKALRYASGCFCDAESGSRKAQRGNQHPQHGLGTAAAAPRRPEGSRGEMGKCVWHGAE